MDNIEKIIDILEKEGLMTSSESEFIKNESGKDETIKAFVENYGKFKSLFHSNDHVDPEILGEYLLYDNGDEEVSKYIPLISAKIKTHLGKCTNCNTEFLRLQEEYRHIENYLDKKINVTRSVDSKRTFAFLRSFPVNYRVAVGAVLILLSAYAGMKVTSEITTPFYKKNVISLEEDQNLSTRGRTSQLFQKSISALSKENFKSAINYLNEDIEKNNDDKSIFYSYYILGLTHLKNSVHNFLGTFKSFDPEEIDQAINNLELSIEKNNSGLYNNLNYDAHYYIAVGFLIRDNTIAAKEHLNIVKTERGRFYKEAIEILNDLEKN